MKSSLPIAALLLTACSLPDGGTDELTATVQNQSGGVITQAGLYARQTAGRSTVLTDSVLLENLAPGATGVLTTTESRVQHKDGDFLLRVRLANGRVLRQECCYFTNGQFLTGAARFVVAADTIRVSAP